MNYYKLIITNARNEHGKKMTNHVHLVPRCMNEWSRTTTDLIHPRGLHRTTFLSHY